MKRDNVPVFILFVFLAGATAPAQSPTVPSQEQPRLQEPLDVLNIIRSFQDGPGLRGVGGRGAAPGERARVLSQSINSFTVLPAWWNNAALVARLGLSDDQKARVERAYENHSQNLAASKALLEKEEAQLGRLLEGETIDRSAILSQVDRVIQARGEMERENAAMTLEMREQLTRAQWMQLPQPSVLTSFRVAPLPGTNTAAPGVRGGRGGGRGAAPAGQRQQ